MSKKRQYRRNARFHMTEKQKKIMTVVCAGNQDKNGAIVSWADVDQIIERLDYDVTKAAFAFSIRYLCEKGLCEKGARELRRTKRRSVIVPTHLGFSLMNRAAPAGFQESDDIVEMF